MCAEDLKFTLCVHTKINRFPTMNRSLLAWLEDTC